jgi:hypothetical protein
MELATRLLPSLLASTSVAHILWPLSGCAEHSGRLPLMAQQRRRYWRMAEGKNTHKPTPTLPYLLGKRFRGAIQLLGGLGWLPGGIAAVMRREEWLVCRLRFG